MPWRLEDPPVSYYKQSYSLLACCEGNRISALDWSHSGRVHTIVRSLLRRRRATSGAASGATSGVPTEGEQHHRYRTYSTPSCMLYRTGAKDHPLTSARNAEAIFSCRNATSVQQGHSDCICKRTPFPSCAATFCLASASGLHRLAQRYG